MGALREARVTAAVHSVNWSEPAVLTLDHGGMILDCSDSSEVLFGYSRLELIKQHVSMLLPKLSNTNLVHDGRFNQRLGFLSHCGHLFRAHSRDGDTFFSKLNFVQLEYGSTPIIRLLVRPTGDSKSENFL